MYHVTIIILIVLVCSTSFNFGPIFSETWQFNCVIRIIISNTLIFLF